MSIWPNDQQKLDPQWTSKFPRPVATTWPWTIPSVENAQQEWDTAEAARQQHQSALDAVQAEREQRETQAAANLKAMQDAYGAEQRERSMTELRVRFFQTPGVTEAEWERVKDDLFVEHAKHQALASFGKPLVVNPYH